MRGERGPAGTAPSWWRPDPYLHVSPDRIFNPHADRLLKAGEPGYDLLRSLLENPEGAGADSGEVEALVDQGWLVGPATDPDRLYRLKYVSLEAHTACNQKCYFCPVSVAPRDAEYMPMAFYESIVGQIAELGEPIEAVFMNGYNEPTTDPRFIDLVGCLKASGLPPAVLTNGTGLTAERVDRLVEMGGLAYLCVNLSTLDREKYRRDRCHDHLGAVLKNIDHIKDVPLAPRMEIVVLGAKDEKHLADYRSLSERLSGSRFEVKLSATDDRAAYFSTARSGDRTGTRCGCELMGSRPIQHLHINPQGQCVLCCQDYDETVVVGELKEEGLREVLEGDRFAEARRRVYGLDPAPEGFICDRCEFALRR